MTESQIERDPVEELADEFIERYRRGEHPTVGEYARRYPDHAAEIEDLFPTILAVEQLKVHSQHSDGTTSLGGSRPEYLGDFRVIREIGRGGMGVVYEAEQQSLGRHVAVKVLPRHALHSKRQLERFRREAQTAARLHHTNIVPVFGVGEDEGFHYYVMQLINGEGLDAILERMRTSGTSRLLHSGSTRHIGRINHPATDLADAASDTGSSVDDDESRVAQAPTADASSLIEAGSSGVLSMHDGSPPDFDAEDPDDGPDEDRVAAVTPVAAPDAPTVHAEAPPHADVDEELDELAVTPPAPVRLDDATAHARRVAEIGIQIASALQYAHAQGVLHRDVKPSNLLLDEHGNVWIADFGLARAVHHDDMTHSGDVLGTLRYMAPEQFNGKVDRRTDIYSLGLTLYELLTRRPAFDDADRTRLLHRIATQQPPRPRSLDPSIPRDLETIILKTIAPDPGHRYDSADQLVEDLRRFLEDRPILARRAGPVELLWRWCRRNPALASLSATAAALLVLVAVVASVGYVRTKAALDGEEAQRRRAEASSELAAEALDKVFESFTPQRPVNTSDLNADTSNSGEFELPIEPTVSEQTAAVLESLLVYYDRLAAQSDTDPAMTRKAADANRRVGDIRSQLGQPGQALKSYRRSLEIYDGLLARQPDDTAVIVAVARLHNEIGGVLRHQRRTTPARDEHNAALARLEAMPADTRPPDAAFELARTHYLLAVSHFGRGPRRPPTPDNASGDAPDRPEGPRNPEAQRGPDRPRPANATDTPRSRRGGANGSAERSAHLNTAIDLLTPLIAAHPDAPDYQHLLAMCLRDSVSPFRSDEPDAQANTQRALDILEALVAKYPGVPDYRLDLAETYGRIDGFRFDPSPDQITDAIAHIERAANITADLVAHYPNIPRYKFTNVANLSRLGSLLLRDEQYDRAVDALTTASHQLGEITEQAPTEQQLSLTMWRVRVRRDMATALVHTGQVLRARDELDSAVVTLDAMHAEDFDSGFLRMMISRSYSEIAETYEQLGDPESAAALRARAQHLSERRDPRPDRRDNDDKAPDVAPPPQ